MKKSIITYKRLRKIAFAAIVAIFAGTASVCGQENTAKITETDSTIAMSNSHVKIIFPKGKAFDISFLSLNGKDVIPGKWMNTAPWILTYKGPQGENPDLFPWHGVYEGYTVNQDKDKVSVTFKWTMKLTYDMNASVDMTVSLPDDSELLYFDIAAGTPEGWIISNTKFPRIAMKRLGDDKLITTAGWGAEYDLKPQLYTASYPSVTGSMQMLLVHNNDGAIYFATQDRGASGKDFKAACGAENITLFTDVVASEGWSDHATGRFELPWTTVIGYSDKGWEDAAIRWYRPFSYTTEWGNKTLESRNIPEWLYNTDVWIRAKGVNDTVRAAVNKAIDLYGKNTGVHWYFWHNYPYDTHYPDYFPAKPHFAEMIAEVQKRGCYTYPYINGRLWDPSSDSYKTLHGGSASCRKPDGTLYTEIYPTSKVLNTVTCPSSLLWQKIITDLVDKIQNELNTNGVYIDQVACAAPQPCWSSGHGHAKGGGDYWHKSYRSLMDNLRANHLKKGNVLISEENAECYIDMFDMLLTVNSPHSGCRIVPLFPIVYSDRVITSAYTYSPTDRVNRGDFLYETMQCFLYGSQLGWVDPTLLMKDEAKKEAMFLKELTNVRKKQHDVFYGGRYMKEIIPTGDNPEIDVPGFGKANVVGGCEWLSANGKRVQYYVNMDTMAHDVILPNGKNLNIKPLKAVRIEP